MMLADDFTGITRGKQGVYRWIAINESLLTTVEKWRRRPYFCPYKPFYGKWILTCKTHLQDVSLYNEGLFYYPLQLQSR